MNVIYNKLVLRTLESRRLHSELKLKSLRTYNVLTFYK